MASALARAALERRSPGRHARPCPSSRGGRAGSSPTSLGWTWSATAPLTTRRPAIARWSSCPSPSPPATPRAGWSSRTASRPRQHGQGAPRRRDRLHPRAGGGRAPRARGAPSRQRRVRTRTTCSWPATTPVSKAAPSSTFPAASCLRRRSCSRRSSPRTETELHRRTVIVLEEGAEAEVWEQYVSGSDELDAVFNVVSELVIGDNARLRYVCAQDLSRTQLDLRNSARRGRSRRPA